MMFLTKQIDKAVEGRNNQPVTLLGAVHALRDMGVPDAAEQIYKTLTGLLEKPAH